MWLVGPCLVDMKRTYVVFQPAGWHWRWEKTVLQGKCHPCRKPARTYMAQCIDKSLVDGTDMEVYGASLFQSSSLWWEGLKSSKQDTVPGRLGGSLMTRWLTPYGADGKNRVEVMAHLWIELNSWRYDKPHLIWFNMAHLFITHKRLKFNCSAEVRLWPEDGWDGDRLLPLETAKQTRTTGDEWRVRSSVFPKETIL